MTENNPNRVALITGASKRIGANIARSLHQNGFNVILHYHHSKDEALALTAQLNQQRPNSATALFANLIDIPKLEHFTQAAVRVFQRLDVLVNNAAVFMQTPFNQATEDAWDTLVDTNLKAAYFLTKACYPALKKTQGCIINIAAIHAFQPLKHYSIYNISKAGLVMLTRSLARDLAPIVRVNAIAPGMMIWPEGDNALDSGQQTKVLDKIALKRCGTPDDISQGVIYLACHAPYVTGEVLTIDGGRQIIG